MFKILVSLYFACTYAASGALVENVKTKGTSENTPDETERIINGQSAKNGQFPYAAALYYNDRFICTAAVISQTTVLTAAHCVVFNGVTESASSFYVVVGEVNRTSAAATKVSFSSLTVHPEYANLMNDIAFFKTSQPIAFNDNIQPICLAKPETAIDAYNNATAMGWGKTNRFSFRNVLPDVLQYTEQKILPHPTCQLRYGLLGVQVSNKQICGEKFGISGICNGDSGGPFVHYSADKPPVHIGIASFNVRLGCANPLFPAVYTRTSAYTQWVAEASGDTMLCTV